ncbi:diguanylate cyclase [Massilia pinisoli]|uniref:diguanylate cyclase n=1 Tax=Massilia pinisoli TaxID=1772194 RepID=A0ABT2A033_9BURK|nr:diguanylate cyclase [Massilia pinisoli]MCS0585451.1 diguanylate cyclase [Massilia pinisoli]
MLSIPSLLRGRSPARAICWLLLADFVFCIGFAIWSRTLAYDSQIQESTAASRAMASAALHHAESTLDTAGWIVAGVVDRVEADGTAGTAGAALQRLLQARARESSVPLAGLYVIDDAGRLVAAAPEGAGPGAADAVRDAAAYHRVRPERDAHLEAPAGAQVVAVSRRIDGPDGRYAGVAVATIPVRYFQDQYRRMAPGPHGLVALTLANGTPVARFPAQAGRAGDGTHAAAIRLKTKETEAERLHTTLGSARFPLAVDAAVGKDDVLADWRRVTWQESVALAGEMIGVYLVCFWVIAQMRVRERLERTLRSTQEALEKQNAALARLADTDGLTGLSNRRHLDERMVREVARAAREGTPLSLIMIDVDFFKRYNDTYGHAAGDDCLRMVARVLAATVNRPADLAARFGGEEFAVLLPNTAQDGARSIAEAICAGVRGAGMAHAASDLGFVTISAGVATVVPAPGSDGRALVEAADAALYEAKEGGRNGVRAH